MVINSNIAAQVSANNLMSSQAQLGKSLARLSSGSKLISPADDPAGLAVASRLDAQINRTNAAKSNVGNAVSFTQTLDGYLKKVTKALDRMGELAVLAQDVTKTDPDRALYNNEFTQLANYVTSTATKQFNGVDLFSGPTSSPASATLNVTIDSEGSSFAMAAINLGATAYTAATGSGVGTAATAATALTNVKAAMTQLSSDRATIGAYQSRLNLTAEQLTISGENLSAASSRIQDVDMAEASTQFARANILMQSGTAMLAQANQLPQSVLRLLQ